VDLRGLKRRFDVLVALAVVAASMALAILIHRPLLSARAPQGHPATCGPTIQLAFASRSWLAGFFSPRSSSQSASTCIGTTDRHRHLVLIEPQRSCRHEQRRELHLVCAHRHWRVNRAHGRTVRHYRPELVFRFHPVIDRYRSSPYSGQSLWLDWPKNRASFAHRSSVMSRPVGGGRLSCAD
jgi:hypothetical protein